MRKHLVVAILLIGSVAAGQALCSMGGGPKEPPQPSGNPEPGTSAEAPTTRQEAERIYGDAYNDVDKAKKDLAAGKKKNADKRFKKSRERGERAVELDSTYYEAWNLVGFCARKLSDYDKSLAAYDRCLGLKPDYAPAREYLGEALVELGKVDKAREQLAWLERLNATEQRDGLKSMIDSWVAAHPDQAMPNPAPDSSAVDTTTSH
ncbi:MAG: tetratricopeptide repeat protein [Candidatus Eisenbacteria bacterium]|uniref:Tetratricopeptide repeat protein n=1 Tax=Eiseniibacteriota bacterium TaxID=2212470 RepID=A0A538SLK5_UNCEI|nr:MAG: tetratricopeptide repeat protein [Candidatus Eisenbacteria bacterium]